MRIAMLSQSKWYKKPCTVCGEPIDAHMDWVDPPTLCRNCIQTAAKKWYTVICEHCGSEIHVHKDWANPPRICKSCRENRRDRSASKQRRQESTPSVFLCHSSADKPAVRALYSRLSGDKFSVWLDEEALLPGQDWTREIEKAVKQSEVVLVCLSKSSVTKKGFVQKEIRLALDAADERPEDAIYIVPARLEECEVPERLAKWQWVDLFAPSGYERLVSALWAAARSRST